MSGLADVIRPGRRVALADGAGAPTGVLAELSTAARQAGQVELVVGWTPGGLDGLDAEAFAAVHRLDGSVSRYGAWPALLAGPLKPDVVVASICPGAPWFLTEVAWLRAAVDAGAVLAAVEREAVPVLDRGPILPPERVRLVGADEEPPAEVSWPSPNDVERAVGERVAPLVPAGARLRYPPGPIGQAVVDALARRVRIDTTVVTDAVLGLDRRGMLVGRPLAPYVAGSADLYEWADGRADADRTEVTHDLGRLADPSQPLVAVSEAVQLDRDGQVSGDLAGADHAAAASLTVVAVPTSRHGRSTLVDRLSEPVSIPAHDVDVVVTERGCVDVRGLDRDERRKALAQLWGE